MRPIYNPRPIINRPPSPRITPGPKRPPNRGPKPRPRPRPRPAPRVDRRGPPPASRGIGKLFRSGPLAALYAYFDMNPAPDQGLGVLSPRAFNDIENPLMFPRDGYEVEEPRPRRAGVVLKPYDWPMLAPPPIELPDELPYWETPLPRVRRGPERDPSPDRNPVPLSPPVAPPLARPRIDPKTGVRQFPRSDQFMETSIGIQSRDDGTVRLQVRSSPRTSRYQRTPRKRDAKSIYMRLQHMITLTFGTATEVQDFVEAFVWNAFDATGKPAMLRERNYALDAVQPDQGDILAAMQVNYLQYLAVMHGIGTGKYHVDVGGFLFDYAVAQASDMEAALISKANERMARGLGLDSVIGLQAMSSMHRRLHDMPKEERISYVRSISERFRELAASRLRWSRSWGWW